MAVGFSAYRIQAVAVGVADIDGVCPLQRGRPIRHNQAEGTHSAPYPAAKKEYRKRNGSGAVYDDPRVAVGAGRVDGVGAQAEA
jgi:hypothetical protein